jgi:hypothetical protein
MKRIDNYLTILISVGDMGEKASEVIRRLWRQKNRTSILSCCKFWWTENAEFTINCFSSPKFAAAQNWKSFFWDLNLCVVSAVSALIFQIGINRITWLSSPHSTQISNTRESSTNQSGDQRRSYSYDRKSTRPADPRISHLLVKFLPSCVGKQDYAPSEWFATQCCLHSKINILISFRSKDSISL